MFIKDNKFQKLAKLLNMDKPLIIFDVEATGLVIHKDKIVELAYIKVWPDGRLKKGDMIFDPEIPITPEAIAIHGLRRKDVKGKPIFRNKAQELYREFIDCYYAGFNVMNFDLPVLRREFIRVGVDFEYSEEQIIDAKVVWQHMVPRSLSTAYKYYCDKDFRQQHTALGDVEATIEVLVKQLEKHKNTLDWDFIKKIHQVPFDVYADNTRKFYWENGQAYFAFSKHRGKSLVEVIEKHPNFIKWMLEADFSEDTKNIVNKAIEDNRKK